MRPKAKGAMVAAALFAWTAAGTGAAEPGDHQAGHPTRHPAWRLAWARVLDRHSLSVDRTVGTVVDYRGLRDAPAREDWVRLLEQLARAPAPNTRAEALALWIDAYNILAIDTVLRAWPVDSIRDAGSLLWPVWRKQAGSVAGRRVTLHEIEHDILRELDDPRIHAAIVCASTSCPSLRRTPYRAGEIDAQLDEAMRAWLASPTKGLAIDRARRRIRLSRIFDWFEDDFDALGGVPAVLVRYAPEADRAWLEQNARNADLVYFDYDWSVNAGVPGDWKPRGPASTLGAP